MRNDCGENRLVGPEGFADAGKVEANVVGLGRAKEGCVGKFQCKGEKVRKGGTHSTKSEEALAERPFARRVQARV